MDIRYKDLANVTLFDYVKDIIKTFLQEHVDIMENKGSDDSIMITDLGDVIPKFRNWQALLPRVTPLYVMDFTSIETKDVALFDDEKDVKTLVEEYVHIQNQNGSGDAFMITDLGDVINKFRNWQAMLPRVTPFYAVKCNNDPMILKLMTYLGSSFDCASQEEIRSILSLGVTPERIIYAHPCKQASMLTYAAKHHVITMTFDNEDELYKTQRLCPEARLVIRIKAPGIFKTMGSLNDKFGCHLGGVTKLLKLAKTLDLNVVGVSFHVGWGCQDPRAYFKAIQAAREVIDKGRVLGFPMDLLDIGGGFPGQSFWPVPFKKYANTINEALNQYFPSDAENEVTIIAEPGTYFVASASTVVTNIIAKREVISSKEEIHEQEENGHGTKHGVGETEIAILDEPKLIMYYINDGVYGVLGVLKQSEVQMPIHSLKTSQTTYKSKIWGPTCDSIDSVNDSIELPEHDIGEWLYFPDMGAYTITFATGFNGMPQPKQNYVCLKQTWTTLYKNGSDKQQ